MLLELQIEHVALIDRLTLGFDRGFHVLTGETGAGKSIVVDAIALILGGRADRTLIRTGEKRASVSALFDIADNADAQALLQSWAMETDDQILPIAREIAQERSVCRVCGSVVPLAKLRQLTSLLVDLHGQHEHQQLADPMRHLAYLDAFGDAAHQALIARVGTLHARWRGVHAEIARLRADVAERERLRDMLLYQIGDIESVKPKAGEDAALAAKSALLRNAEKVSGAVSKACDMVYRGGRGLSAQDSLKRAAGALEGIASLDPRYDALFRRLDGLVSEAEDIGYELSACADEVSVDPAQVDKIDDRLAALQRLTRKYGDTIADVLAFRDAAKARLDALDEGEDRLNALERAEADYRAELTAVCAELTASRSAIAASFSARMQDELRELGMPKARLSVRILPLMEPSARGADDLCFLFTANAGEPEKPLSDVASGGEMSRVMLAMKAIAADKSGVDTMIFDEIDTGVSGRAAQVVGERMALIAGRRQVICVTHLPQIAALGDRQYLVEKVSAGDRTDSSVRLLDAAGRVDALSRMIGGADEMASAREHAANLLQAAALRVGTIRADALAEG